MFFLLSPVYLCMCKERSQMVSSSEEQKLKYAGKKGDIWRNG